MGLHVNLVRQINGGEGTKKGRNLRDAWCPLQSTYDLGTHLSFDSCIFFRPYLANAGPPSSQGLLYNGVRTGGADTGVGTMKKLFLIAITKPLEVLANKFFCFCVYLFSS